MSSHELDDETLEAIFREAIAPTLRPLAAGGERTLHLVAAQPGAGKTRALQGMQAEHPEALLIEGDLLRRHHPDYARLMAANPLAMPDATAQASGAWVRRSIEFAMEHGWSAIVEGTFRRTEVVEQTARRFREAGYEVEATVLAVPAEQSRLGIVSRYVDQLHTTGAGRWTPAAVHDAAVKNLPHALERLQAGGLADRIGIRTRSGELRWSRDFLRDAAAIGEGDSARDALLRTRMLEVMPPADARLWLGTFQNSARYLLDRGERSIDVGRTLGTLSRDAERVLYVAWGHDPAQLQEQASRLVDVAGAIANRNIMLLQADTGGRRLIDPATRPPSTPSPPSIGRGPER